MTIKDLKQKYLDFFASRGHAIIPGASLIPENDPTVLFTTAGMHPLVPYLLGEKHPAGKRLVDVQKCIRTGDIDKVGDGWHLTFFEMLGNWSLGDSASPDGAGGAGYGKDEAIKLSFEFLTKELNIPLEKLAFSCFSGDEAVPKDEASAKVWESLGAPAKRIVFLGKDDNWWGPAGQVGPCGPDTEIFYWSGEQPAPEEFDPQDQRWVEIWNDVFMIYNKTAAGQYEELKQKNVDTGMGVERTVAVLNNKENIYEIEQLATIIAQILALAEILIEDLTPEQTTAVRIIADHLRAAVFILAEGQEPSNVERGYVLRRLIRRAIRYGLKLNIKEPLTPKIAEVVIAQMSGFYKNLREKREFIFKELAKEEEKFSQTLENGLATFERMIFKPISKTNPWGGDTTPMKDNKINYLPAEKAFKLFTTYGFPFEMTKELAAEQGIGVDENGFWQEFKKHQELSRAGAAKKFKGGLADNSELTTKLHTATHLLLAALRKILGNQVYQKGANITTERIRFDFSYNDKMTPAQISRVENLVNEQIALDLPVACEEMTLAEAKKHGAMGIFENKYGERVKVYSVGGDVTAQCFSKEICGGPHAVKTGDLGHFKIIKEESSSAGVRRIKAILE